MTQCETIRATGERCRAQALPNRPLCFAHDPENRARAGDARRKGGHNRATTVRAARRIPKDMQELSRLLMEAVDQVHAGELDHRRATAMAALAGAVCRVHEIGELSLEVQALRERLESQQGGKRWGA